LKYYAELELLGLGKIAHPIEINDPKEELYFPVAGMIQYTQPLRDIAEAAGLNFKRYKFLRVGMYPSEFGFRETDEQGRTIPYVKSFTVLYELGEII
jgi:hypothetical protein